MQRKVLDYGFRNSSAISPWLSRYCWPRWPLTACGGEEPATSAPQLPRRSLRENTSSPCRRRTTRRSPQSLCNGHCDTPAPTAMPEPNEPFLPSTATHGATGNRSAGAYRDSCSDQQPRNPRHRRQPTRLLSLNPQLPRNLPRSRLPRSRQPRRVPPCEGNQGRAGRQTAPRSSPEPRSGLTASRCPWRACAARWC